MSAWTRADLVGYLKAGAPSANTHIRDNYIEKMGCDPQSEEGEAVWQAFLNECIRRINKLPDWIV